MILKIRYKDINIKENFPSDILLIDFLTYLSEKFSIPIYLINIFSGYPSHQIVGEKHKRITEIGIENGSLVRIEERFDLNIIQNLIEMGIPPQVVENVLEDTSCQNPDELYDKCLTYNNTGNSNLHIKSIESDNSCLFNAINYSLNLENNASNMRKIVSEHITKNKDDFSNGILGKPVSEYCDWILDPKHWGGDIELAIFSEVFKVKIGIGNILSGQVLVFGEDKDFSNIIYLLFDGIHYDSIYQPISDQNSQLKTIFSSDDTETFEQVKSLVLDKKRLKKYVDTSSFQIKCNICGLHLTGENDALAHSKATSHVDFTQI